MITHSKIRLLIIVPIVLCVPMGFVIVSYLKFQLGKSPEFFASSGFRMPSNAKVILNGDDHGGFQGDGEYYVVFDVSPQDANAYLSKSPWRNVQWQRGPVPEGISSHCMNLIDRYSPVFASPHVWYLAEDFGQASLSFHNGRMIVIDPKQNRVFYSQWDF